MTKRTWKRWAAAVALTALCTAANADVTLTLKNGHRIEGLACVRAGAELHVIVKNGPIVRLPFSAAARLEHDRDLKALCAEAEYLCQDRALRLAIAESYSADFLQPERARR